jgi:hypothetical protein
LDKLGLVLSVLVLIILIYGLVYTVRIGLNQKKQKSEFDTEVDEKVQDHSIIRNPIFLTYLIAALLIGFYIIYMSLGSSWAY